MEIEMSILDIYIEIIKEALLDNPNPALILSAKYLMVEFDREFIPDWVATLAGGNIHNWEAVLEETISEMRQEGNDDSP